MIKKFRFAQTIQRVFLCTATNDFNDVEQLILRPLKSFLDPIFENEWKIISFQLF